MPNRSRVRNTSAEKRGTKPEVTSVARSVHSCNFRTAGRISNEDARIMTELHERVAQSVSHALDIYLGKSAEIAFTALDQQSIQEHVNELVPQTFIAPFRTNAFFVELENALVLPMIDLLMGGTGGDPGPTRDLSEIEEEIAFDIVLLIAQQCERAWGMSDSLLSAGARMKASALHQVFALNDKATVMRFEIECAGAKGSFSVVLTSESLNAVLKKAKENLPQKRPRVLPFVVAPLRERILDCDLEATTELAGLKVSVRDLIALQPGTVLKLHAPIRDPAELTVGGRAMFEAAPVRSGSQRAAQLGKRVRSTEEMKG